MVYHRNYVKPEKFNEYFLVFCALSWYDYEYWIPKEKFKNLNLDLPINPAWSLRFYLIFLLMFVLYTS